MSGSKYTVIVSGVAGRTPKNICLRCDLQFQYPAQPDTEKLEIDLRQIFFGGRPATPDTSIPQLYNQAITQYSRWFLAHELKNVCLFRHCTWEQKFKSICWIFPVKKKLFYLSKHKIQINYLYPSKGKFYLEKYKKQTIKIELVSMELNHFGAIAGLFWQIGGHSSIFVLLCSF